MLLNGTSSFGPTKEDMDFMQRRREILLQKGASNNPPDPGALVSLHQESGVANRQFDNTKLVRDDIMEEAPMVDDNTQL